MLETILDGKHVITACVKCFWIVLPQTFQDVREESGRLAS